MSLKSFHLVFIACSSALAFLFGAWVLRSGTLVGLPRLAAGFSGFAIGSALIAYEAWFWRYSRRS